MADTIITNTPPGDKSGDSGSGWAVALVIIIAIIAVVIYLYQRGTLHFGAQDTSDTYNTTNIIVPNPKDSGTQTVK